MAVSISDLITYFDQKWQEGSLVGSGPGKSGEHRLNAFRNMLQAAYNAQQYGVNEGAQGAINQLERLQELCDGTRGDFVEGAAVEELAQGIEHAATTAGGGETPEWPPPAFVEKIFGGTSPNGKLLEWDGINAWVEVADSTESQIWDLAVFDSRLYGGTYPNGKLLEWNGTDAWVEKAPQFGTENLQCLATFEQPA